MFACQPGRIMTEPDGDGRVRTTLLPLLSCLLALALAGCLSSRTQANYQAQLNSYVGQHVDAVVLQLGPPDSSYQLADGRWIHEWEEERTQQSFTQALPRTQVLYDSDGNPVPITSGITTQPTTRTYNCTTRIVADNKGTVLSWTADGNDCRS